MLHHETETDTNAAQVRVTAEEMAKAISALESRKHQEAQQLAGTLSIGEAIEDLHLDATPAELLAEVNAQRERDKARLAMKQPVPPQPTVSKGFALPPQPIPPKVNHASPALQAVNGFRFRGQNRQGRQRPPIFVFFALFGLLPMIIHSSHHTAKPAPLTSTTVALLPEDVRASCDTTTLRALKSDTPQKRDKAIIQTGRKINFSQNGDAWEIIKKNGELYVRGYIIVPSKDNPTVPSVQHLYNGGNVDELYKNVAQAEYIRLDKLDWDGNAKGGKDWQEIDVTSIPLDEYSKIEKH